MPQRQNILQFDSTEVQGEGSWIKVRMVTHGEGKMFQSTWADVIAAGTISDLSLERRQEFQAASDDLVVKNVIDWNWVNDDNEPLPLPKDDPGVVDQLTELEHQFIGKALRGDGERKK